MKNKILIITSEFPPLPGGIGNHAFLLSKYLQKNNYEVSVLSDFRNETQDLEFDSKQNFKVYRIKRNKFTQVSRIKKAYFLGKQNDVILFSGKFSLWIGGFQKKIFPRKKFIAVLHGSELKAGGIISNALTKWSLKEFDRLVAVSNFTRNYALSIIPQSKIEVVNNGIEIESFLEFKHDQADAINLVTVGNVTFRKGQDNVIKALPLLREKFPTIHYHCIGIPTEKEKFMSLAKSLDVLSHITFHGALIDLERNAILKKSTIFLMLSNHVKNDFEGFGIALLEANAFGIPAIGSRDSGIADAIKNEYSGILVDQKKPLEVLNAITEIVENYLLFSQQSLLWSKAFDWNTVIQNYIKIIENEV